MAMGIVDDSELEAELKRNQVQIIERQRPGRSPGDVNVPEALRKIISETAITDGRTEAVKLADMFGVSPSSTSAYARGSTTTDAPKNSNQVLAEANRKVFGKIQKKAQTRLIMALDRIDGDTLANCNAVESSQVAKNLAGIVKDFTPELRDPTYNNPHLQQQLVIYAPFIRREDEFPVINALGE